MIINNINGFDYRINFKYSGTGQKPSRFRTVINGNPLGYDPRTVQCQIESVKTGGKFKDEGNSIGNGQSICSPEDNFNKAKGRKLALARALVFCPLAKEERKEFWKQYFENVKS